MYNYEAHKSYLKTDEGLKKLKQVMRKIDELLQFKHSICVDDVLNTVSGSSWDVLCCFDYLKEVGLIREITNDPNAFAQHRVFV